MHPRKPWPPGPAPFVVTVPTALGAIAWWQFAIAAALSVLCTAAVARLATAVYRRSILRTGAPVRLRDLVPHREVVPPSEVAAQSD